MPLSVGRYSPTVAPCVLLFGLLLPTIATAADSQLRYRWQEGRPYSYRIFCRAEIGESVLEATGTNTYILGRPLGTNRSPAGRETKRSSGTAFVISPDGYLLTCNHVVAQAATIRATIGEQTVRCKVVARDSVHDLAILQVNQKNLPALPLADSDAVPLAEEVRAIGYPLSDVLGSSVKISQGAIAGVVTKPHGKVFQVDATVIPGNSGGPLLNSHGAVVGVVNAQLLGPHVSKVGFAIPINYAKALLKEARIPFQTTTGGVLDGPALAKQVCPSVVFVTVSSDDAAEPDKPYLYYHSVLDRRGQPRSKTTPPEAIGSPDRDDGRMIVEPNGEIRDFKGHVQLPCMLGPLGAAAIDLLPSGGETTWKHQETLTVTAIGTSSHDPLGGIHPPGFAEYRPRSPSGNSWTPERPETHLQAILQATYTADEPQGQTVIIRKSVIVRTVAQDNTVPKMELTGSSKMVFDLQAGTTQAITFSGKFTLREANRTLDVPVVFRCERVTAAEQPKPTPSTSKPSAVSTADADKGKLDSLLADLRAANRDWGRCFRALDELTMIAPVDNRREEVAQLLNKYLDEKSYSSKLAAIRAIRMWGARCNVPPLVALVNSSSSDSVRRHAMQSLAAIGDAEAASVLAGRLKVAADRRTAAQALRTMNVAAEDAVIGCLSDSDSAVVCEACKVLGDIGGPKSAVALRKLLDSPDAGIQEAAQAALAKLQLRK